MGIPHDDDDKRLHPECLDAIACVLHAAEQTAIAASKVPEGYFHKAPLELLRHSVEIAKLAAEMSEHHL